MKRVSVVICCYNEEPALARLFDRLTHLERTLAGFVLEIVFVNDGSEDGTLAGLLQFKAQHPNTVVVDLSRNFGKEAALSAGLATASGDAVIPLDADLQDPPEVIEKMISLWMQGYEVVLARRSDRSQDSFGKRLGARWFYRIHNAVANTRIPADVGDFRLIDRNVAAALNSLPENCRFMKGLFAWVGFRTVTIEYERPAREAGKSRFTGLRLWNLALEGITSFSLLPLRVWSYVGAAVAVSSLTYAAWIVIRTIFYGIDVPGYASIFVAVLFLGGLQLIGIGIVGEYLGRTYLESKRRPAYLIRQVY